MTKKIILLLCTLFCINGAFAKTEQPLTTQETTIYNEIIKKYEQNKPVEEINQFLQEKNLSIQDFYTILSRQLSILNQEDTILFQIIFPNTPLVARIMDPKVATELTTMMESRAGTVDQSTSGLAAWGSIIGFFIASPIVATGLAIKHYMAPSPIQNIVSSGLIGSGAIIASGIPLFYASIVISKKLSVGLSSLYESITHKKQNARIRRQAIENEMQKIINIMNYLKSLYPELQ